LNELAQDFGGFEGNAQSFRLLTRLEPKAFGPQEGPRPGQSLGLNLTRAALDAASKYPWTRKPDSSKFGVYDDDVDVFTWVRDTRADERTCFEAQVMDWADDVAYSVHDIEDAVHAGHIDVGILQSTSGRGEVIEIARQWYGEGFDALGLDEALLRIAALPSWPASFNGTLKSMAELKNLTSTLIGRFCLAAQRATRAQYGDAILARYGADLVVPTEARYEVTALKALAARFVMNREGATAFYAAQRHMIMELHAELSKDPEHHLEPAYADLWTKAQSGQARVLVDQIAALTDVSLTQWHATLCP
jgi:dGTPase